MLCKGCNKEIKDGSEFCGHCGAKVQKEPGGRVCPSCGKQLEDNSKFCKHCGKPVDKKEPDSKNGKDKKTNLVMNIVIIALLAVVVALVIFRFTGSTNKEKDSNADAKDSVSSEDTFNFGGGTETSGGGTETPGSGTDTQAVEVNGIYYTLMDNTLYLSGDGSVDKKTIKSFSKEGFDHVVFDTGTIDIPDDTFSGFSDLKIVELKNVVRKIGARAFKGCGIDHIAIGKSVTEIGEDAFVNCKIAVVYLNNPKIRANLNKKTDFGRLFEYASTIAVFYGNDQTPTIGWNLGQSSWGTYLRNNDMYNTLVRAYNNASTVEEERYNMWSCARNDYNGCHVFEYNTGVADKSHGIGYNYDGEKNIIEYKD